MSDLPQQVELSDERAHAGEDLLPQVYEELRRLAEKKLSDEVAGQTLQPTALVHEAWLRIAGKKDPGWSSRSQFYVAAAQAMQRILIDNARRKKTAKRGGGWERLNLEDLDFAADAEPETLLSIESALERFEEHHPEKAELVRLKFYAGLTHSEAGVVMGISEPTAKRYWSFSRAWLLRELQRSEEE